MSCANAVKRSAREVIEVVPHEQINIDHGCIIDFLYGLLAAALTDCTAEHCTHANRAHTWTRAASGRAWFAKEPKHPQTFHSFFLYLLYTRIFPLATFTHSCSYTEMACVVSAGCYVTKTYMRIPRNAEVGRWCTGVWRQHSVLPLIRL